MYPVYNMEVCRSTTWKDKNNYFHLQQSSKIQETDVKASKTCSSVPITIESLYLAMRCYFPHMKNYMALD